MHQRHFASQCFTKTVVAAAAATTEEVTLTSTFVGALAHTDQICWQATIVMEGVNVAFKLDTGADVTAISSETYQICHETPLETSTL